MTSRFAERFGAGSSPKRVEDPRLLRGEGRFVADLDHEGTLYSAFVRSPHARARIVSVDVDAAQSSDGVALCLTGQGLRDLGACPLGYASVLKLADGTPMTSPPRWPLAIDEVRYVGDPVALVVATTRHAALAAAESVVVTYEPLPAIVDAARAPEAGAPVLWPPAPDNVAGFFSIGDSKAVDARIAGAPHVTRLRCSNNRVIVNPMEPRGALASYQSQSGYTLHAPLQAPHLSRDIIAESLGALTATIRIIVGDMGGGFGARITPYPEEVALLLAARLAGRPIRWIADRSECFLSDSHARDHISDVTLALEKDGRILAARFDVIANIGAHFSYFGANAPTHTGNRVATGAYAIPDVSITVRTVLTNTVPTGPYRGAGRPEAVYRLERCLDLAARELDIDPVTIRKRNFIKPAAMPYKTATGARYDSGNYAAVLARACTLAETRTLPSRRKAAKRRGRLLGRGIAFHVDTTSSLVPSETVSVAFSHNGVLALTVGTQAMGQGLETTFAQMAAARFNLPLEHITIIQGDTALVPAGNGSYGSRSLYIGGSALALALDDLVRTIRQDLGWPPKSDAEHELREPKTGAIITLAEALRRLGRDRIEASATFTAENCFPNGCHICEVEIDQDTGAIFVTRFVAVDDVGTIMNPAIVDGQIHGGVVQGVGQALFEACVYDSDGQLLSGSLMDYALPRAKDVPLIDVDFVPTPSPTNPLGAKGGGESGAIGAPPAVVNAVVDALSGFGVRHVDMPIRPEAVWRLMRDARALTGATL